MGSFTTLYLTDEVKEILEKKKEQEPDFNLSRFIQDKILQTDEKREDPDELGLEIEKKNSQIEILKKEVDLLSEKKRKAEIQKETSLKEETEREIKIETKYKADLEIIKNNFTGYFKVSESEALEHAEAYMGMDKETRGTIFTYGKDHGLEDL